MYLIMRDELGPAHDSWPSFYGDLSGYRSGEDRVYENDFEAVLAVLAGPSQWQEHIRQSLRVARQNLPRRAFRVVNSEEFVRTMRALGERATAFRKTRQSSLPRDTRAAMSSRSAGSSERSSSDMRN